MNFIRKFVNSMIESVIISFVILILGPILYKTKIIKQELYFFYRRKKQHIYIYIHITYNITYNI